MPNEKDYDVIIEGNIRVKVSKIVDLKTVKESLMFDNPAYLQKVRFGHAFGPKPPKYLEFYTIEDEDNISWINLPRNYPWRDYVKNPDTINVFNATVYNREPNMKWSGVTLRDYQQEFLDSNGLLDVKTIPQDFLIQAPCGHGKTLMALYVALNVIKTKTLIVVPTNFLAEQWEETILGDANSNRKIENFRIGRADALKRNIISLLENSNIIIITVDYFKSILSNISNSQYTRARFSAGAHVEEKFYRLLDTVGCVILDEYHRFGSYTWSNIVGLLPARYRIVCTATPRRGDSMYELLEYHCGKRLVMDNQFEPADFYCMLSDKAEIPPAITEKALQKVKVKGDNQAKVDEKIDAFYALVRKHSVVIDGMSFVKCENVRLDEKFKSHKWVDLFEKVLAKMEEKFLVGHVDTAIMGHGGRVKEFLNLVEVAVKSGRVVLVISKRKNALKLWHSLFKSKGYKSCLVLGGEKDKKALMEYARKEAQVIFGIDRLTKEGLDIDSIDTLMPFHPISDYEQAIGRVIRIKKGKKPPIVIQVWDKNIPEYQGIIRKGLKNIGHANNRGLKLKEEIIKIIEQ
jgi:superfamily II DNA or RNA helicase